MNYNWNELLNGLDSIFADYGNRDLELPEHLKKSFYEDDLTEEEAKEIFELNDGDVDATIEYLNKDE